MNFRLLVLSKYLLIILGFSMGINSPAAQTIVYKVVNPDGSISYSGSPPVSTSTYKELKIYAPYGEGKSNTKSSLGNQSIDADATTNDAAVSYTNIKDTIDNKRTTRSSAGGSSAGGSSAGGSSAGGSSAGGSSAGGSSAGGSSASSSRKLGTSPATSTVTTSTVTTPTVTTPTVTTPTVTTPTVTTPTVTTPTVTTPTVTTESNKKTIFLKSSFPKLATTSYIGVYTDPTMQKLWAKYDLLILGANLPLNAETSAIKKINPYILIGAYTVLNEARRNAASALSQERLDKINHHDWWLRDESKSLLQWSADYGTTEVNVSHWVKPDTNGDQYPEWAAKFWYRRLFQQNPDFDIWYFDNVFFKQRIKEADWKLTGKNQSGNDPDIQAEFRRAQAKEFKVASELASGLMLLGNTDNDLSYDEYKNQLHGGMMECLIGPSYAIETWGGWNKMMERYKKVTENLSDPKVTIFGACLPDLEDYRMFRYAFTSSLMGDAYFQVSATGALYREFPWYDEFNVNLGLPIDPAFPSAKAQGYYIRHFEKGLVLVNPTNIAQYVSIPAGYKAIDGIQDKAVNNGQSVTSVLLKAKDGIILTK